MPETLWAWGFKPPAWATLTEGWLGFLEGSLAPYGDTVPIHHKELAFRRPP